jgi:hypothetical protein
MSSDFATVTSRDPNFYFLLYFIFKMHGIGSYHLLPNRERENRLCSVHRAMACAPTVTSPPRSLAAKIGTQILIISTLYTLETTQHTQHRASEPVCFLLFFIFEYIYIYIYMPDGLRGPCAFCRACKGGEFSVA